MAVFNSLWTTINDLEKETVELKKLIGVTDIDEIDKQRIFKWGNTVRNMMNMTGIEERTQNDFNSFFKNFVEKLDWLISITEGVLPIFKTYYEQKSGRSF